MQLIAEGKTKQVWRDGPTCFITQKDDITAGDGTRKHHIPGKGTVAAQTTANVFAYLNELGVPTHFIEMVGENEMIVKPCEMIPLEVVCRRIATGSYIKRHPDVPEGTRFDTPVQEFFLKDDANHDPLISTREITQQGILGGLDLAVISEAAIHVFLALELAWHKQNVTLVDLKVEFGHDIDTGQPILADVIDNDSWRIWPEGDKNKMLDKQIYRNMKDVTTEALNNLLESYKQVEALTRKFHP
jgi:phosphoribosylaminoimidazole-succinocarboxamide synthase